MIDTAKDVARVSEENTGMRMLPHSCNGLYSMICSVVNTVFAFLRCLHSGRRNDAEVSFPFDTWGGIVKGN